MPTFAENFSYSDVGIKIPVFTICVMRRLYFLILIEIEILFPSQRDHRPAIPPGWRPAAADSN